jgi:hypothetical protein
VSRQRKNEIDPQFYTDLGIVTRIGDGIVDEVSNVDDPATDIEFAMFKSIEKAEGLADIEACLRNDVLSPGECESQSEGFGNLLRADVRSHEDSGSPPERTDAIKGGDMRKIEALAGDPSMPVDPAAPAPGPTGEVVEIPGTPVDWSLPECIQAGLDLGFSEDQAGQICLVVRDQYGAAGESGQLLLPEGVKPEAVMAATAESLGFATITGKASAPRVKAPDPKAYRGIGSYWAGKLNAILGRKTEPRPGAEIARYLKTMKEELMAENLKTREDLWRAMQMQDRAHARTSRLLAAALNVELPAEEEEDVETSPAASPAEPALAPNPLTSDGKRKGAKAAKCGAADPAAPAAIPAKAEAPVAPTDSERIARLEGLLEQVVAQLSGGPGIEDLIDEGGDDIEMEEDAELVEETLAAASAGVPGKRASAPPSNPLQARMAQIKAAPLAALRGGVPKGYSRSTVTGMIISDSDRAAAHAGTGINRLLIKR